MCDTTVVGRVKWFNSRAGYGFLTVTNGENSGNDVFVHHSSLTTQSELYKYLLEGEYVSFNLEVVENEDHEYQAKQVTGVHGGKLMCETRAETREKRNSNNEDSGQGSGRPSRYPSARPQQEGDEFVLVRKRRERVNHPERRRDPRGDTRADSRDSR